MTKIHSIINIKHNHYEQNEKNISIAAFTK